MKILIEMAEEKYEWLKKNNQNADPNSIVGAVTNGTPLPKGHGDLIDADETLNAMNTWDKFGLEPTGCFVRNPEDGFIKYAHYEDMVKAVSWAPTIIEADKEDKNE